MSRIFFSLFFLVRTFFYDIRRIFLCCVSHSSYSRTHATGVMNIEDGTKKDALWNVLLPLLRKNFHLTIIFVSKQFPSP